MSKQKHDIETQKVLSIPTHNAEQTDRGRPANARSPKTTEAVPPKRLHGYATGDGGLLLGVKGNKIRMGMTSTGHSHSDPILRIEGEIDVERAEAYVAVLLRAIIEAKKNQIEHGAGAFGNAFGVQPAEGWVEGV